MTTRLTHHTNEERQTRPVHISPNVVCGDKALWIVAGPCAVEGPRQLEAVTQTLLPLGVTSLRGGVFKPRTSPYSFQGLGEDGLALMAEMKAQFGMTLVTEVMSIAQIEAMLPVVDVFQVGSRNMQNFELLKALGQIDRPVLLKRGLCASVDEFLWSAEYIMAGGNARVILCERGIRGVDSETRNILDLGAVAVLKQKSHLPVMVDPSHAAGRRDIIADLSRAAIAVGADGLLIETHPTPESSVSDAEQALSFEDFKALMAHIQPIADAMGRPVSQQDVALCH